IRADIAFLKSLGDVEFKTGVLVTVGEPALGVPASRRRVAVYRTPKLASGTLALPGKAQTPLEEFDAVIVCAGLGEPIKLNIPGEELALSWQAFLENHKHLKLEGKKVAVPGGGSVAADCAT